MHLNPTTLPPTDHSIPHGAHHRPPLPLPPRHCAHTQPLARRELACSVGGGERRAIAAVIGGDALATHHSEELHALSQSFRCSVHCEHRTVHLPRREVGVTSRGER